MDGALNISTSTPNNQNTHENDVGAVECFGHSSLILRNDVDFVELDAFLRESLGAGLRRVPSQANNAIRLRRIDEVVRDAAALIARDADNDSKRSGGVLSRDHCTKEDARG